MPVQVEHAVYSVQTTVPKRYLIHEVFGPTVQGEGQLAGAPCLFIRFSVCNMWSGRPEDQAESRCPFCDTDFYGGDRLTAEEIVFRLKCLGSPHESVMWVWISGGEPTLQLDADLLDHLHRVGWNTAVETNGTRIIDPEVRRRIDHLTVSPKLPWDQTRQREGDTLKLLYPHPNPLIRPEAFEEFTASAFYLQPIDTGDIAGLGVNTALAVKALFRLPGWRLSLQLHKYLGMS